MHTSVKDVETRAGEVEQPRDPIDGMERAEKRRELRWTFGDCKHERD